MTIDALKNPINKDNVFIVAEIGNNHEGDYSLAEEMIYAASESGVDAVKFQTFKPEKFVSKSDSSRLDQLTKFQLTYDQFYELSIVAEKIGLNFFSTPLDIESAYFLNSIQSIFKISSGDNNYFDLIDTIGSFDKPTIISTGILDFPSIKKLHKYWIDNFNPVNLFLLHCVSSYPAEDKHLNLGAIDLLKNNFPGNAFGYSDHSIGNLSALAAVAKGSKIIEKHFTLDKDYSDFRDHKLSADPAQMKKLVMQIRKIETMLSSDPECAQEPERQIEPLVRRSIFAAKNLFKGDILTQEDIIFLRPGDGLTQKDKSRVINKKIIIDIKSGQKISDKFLE